MGFFGKERAGSFKAVDGSGRRFVWTIENFSTYAAGTTLDSENVNCFTKVKFHLHMSLGASVDVGLYIHYKKPPIPKYSYHFENSKMEVMRQHTAHTIPVESERCGHWNVCSYTDMREFLGTDDTLIVQFIFDDDSLAVKPVADKNTVSALWTIPDIKNQNLSPYSSRGFFVDNTLLVARLDIKGSSGDSTARYSFADVNTIIIFLFCRKGKIPPHSVELVDAAGNPYHCVERNADGTALTVMVDRKVVDANIADSGTLFVKISFFSGGNPLDVLNALSGMSSEQGGNADGGRTVEVGDKKELYNVMDD